MLECVRAQSFSYVRLFASPWSVACQNFNSVNGIFQARIPEWVAISYSRGSSQFKMDSEAWHAVIHRVAKS